MSAKIPEGYRAVTPYLILKNAAGFIEFTQKIFGAKLINKHMRDENIIMHAEIKIVDSVIMFADSTEQYPLRNGGFFIYVEDADKTYKEALDNGATVVTEIGNQSYGRSGGVKDAFGNTWWLTTAI